jgi:hypothetical protein
MHQPGSTAEEFLFYFSGLLKLGAGNFEYKKSKTWKELNFPRIRE